MNYFEVTSVSSRGQVVIPLTFRKRLRIRPGAKLIVLSDGHNLLLKPFAPPALNAFQRLIKKSAGITKAQP